MKDNSIINEIIIKVVTGEALTSAENTMYEEFIADEANRELVEKFRSGAYQRQMLQAMHAIDLEGGRAILEAELNRNYGKQVDIQQKPVRKIFRDVATSAAAVLVILTAAIFLWRYIRQDKAIEVKEAVKTVAQKEIGPGQQAASLTLADGSKVLLDSTRTGQLTRQGGTVVMNENGTLQYQAKRVEQEELFNTLTTAYAQTYAMVLADGSKVWLNAGASIRYPVEFTGRERRVEVSGEVYFEVAHNEDKPFIVHVTGQKGPVDVQVLGTHFNINAYDDEAVIKTTLLEGSVQIKHKDYQTLLAPGQQSQVGNGAPQVINNVNVDAVVAWKNGLFSFNSTDLAVVMPQLIKWYNIEVKYEGGAKPSDKISGDIRRSSTLQEVAENLGLVTDLKFRIEGRKLIVSAASPNGSQKNTK